MYANKTVLITGASSGLGKKLAIEYAKNNAKIINLSRNQEKMINLNKQLNQINFKKNKYFSIDISHYKEVEKVKNSLLESNDIPDIIINNAAGNFLCKFENLSLNGWRRINDIVLNGNFNITHNFGKLLIDQNKSGIFLNISTTYSDKGTAYAAPSAAAKAGCDALMKSLSVEWGKKNIRFVGIAPGGMKDTGGIKKLDKFGLYDYYNKINNPSSRLANLQEISDLAIFLTSENASYINGEIVTIDGGEINKNSGQFSFLQNIPYFDKLLRP